MDEIPARGDVIANFFEKDNVFRTQRDTHCRNVLLKRSMSLVPVSLPTAQCRLLGKTADILLALIALERKQRLWNDHQRDNPQLTRAGIER